MANVKRAGKIEEVTADLDAARKALADAETELRPQIREEARKIAELKLAYDTATKAYDALYEQTTRIRNQVRAIVNVPGVDVVKAKVAAFVAEKNLPKADVDKLAVYYVAHVINTHPTWQEFSARLNVARDLKENAYRVWNVANRYGKPLDKMQWRLEALRKRVEGLETLLEKIPLRNQDARDRRQQVKEEAEAQRQTDEARGLLLAEGVSWS